MNQEKETFILNFIQSRINYWIDKENDIYRNIILSELRDIKKIIKE